MQSLRQFMYKLTTIKNKILNCNEVVTFDGSQGIFIFNINLGEEVGGVNINYQAFGIPDRFQVEYDGSIVADSLYVGDNITGNPPNGDNIVDSTYTNVPELEWNGTSFQPNGNVRDILIEQDDVAPQGQTAGAGSIFFQKNTATPANIKITVFAPLGSTSWNLNVDCPDGILGT